MNTLNEKTVQYSCAICLVMALLSSCRSTDEQYAQWNGEPAMIDAGPNRKPAPKPDAMPAPKPDVVTAEGSMESLVTTPSEPVDASYQTEPVEKKKFRLFGRKDKQESREMETVAQVSEAAPVHDVVTAEGSMESLVATSPKPVDVSYQAEPVEKKKFKLFGRNDKAKNNKESADMETVSHVSYAGATNKQIPVVEAPSEPVIHAAPEPVVAKSRTKPAVKRKSSATFDSWLKRTN